MNPFEGRNVSMRLIQLGMMFMAPSLIASVAGIDFWLLNGAFFVGLALLFCAMFVRTKYWRCPHCKTQLHAEAAMTNRCHKCGAQLVETKQE